MDVPVVSPSGGVSRWIGQWPTGLAITEVGVAFVAEEDAPAGDVLVLVGRPCGVPAVAGELLVRAGEEVVSLGVVLTDEQYVRCRRSW